MLRIRVIIFQSANFLIFQLQLFASNLKLPIYAAFFFLFPTFFATLKNLHGEANKRRAFPLAATLIHNYIVSRKI